MMLWNPGCAARAPLPGCRIPIRGDEKDAPGGRGRGAGATAARADGVCTDFAARRAGRERPADLRVRAAAGLPADAHGVVVFAPQRPRPR